MINKEAIRHSKEIIESFNQFMRDLELINGKRLNAESRLKALHTEIKEATHAKDQAMGDFLLDKVPEEAVQAATQRVAELNTELSTAEQMLHVLNQKSALLNRAFENEGRKNQRAVAEIYSEMTREYIDEVKSAGILHKIHVGYASF